MMESTSSILYDGNIDDVISWLFYKHQFAIPFVYDNNPRQEPTTLDPVHIRTSLQLDQGWSVSGRMSIEPRNLTPKHSGGTPQLITTLGMMNISIAMYNYT